MSIIRKYGKQFLWIAAISIVGGAASALSVSGHNDSGRHRSRDELEWISNCILINAKRVTCTESADDLFEMGYFTEVSQPTVIQQ